MEGGANFFLRLSGFESNIKSFWKEIQIEEDFCDVTLACDNKEIKAHRVIISSSSPVLRNILRQNQNSSTLIYLRNVQFKDLQLLVTFMYQGEVNVDEEDLGSFLEAAKDLQITGLPWLKMEGSELNQENDEPTQYLPQTTIPSPIIKCGKYLERNISNEITLTKPLTKKSQKNNNFIDNLRMEKNMESCKSKYENNEDSKNLPQKTLPTLIKVKIKSEVKKENAIKRTTKNLVTQSFQAFNNFVEENNYSNESLSLTENQIKLNRHHHNRGPPEMEGCDSKNEHYEDSQNLTRRTIPSLKVKKKRNHANDTKAKRLLSKLTKNDQTFDNYTYRNNYDNESLFSTLDTLSSILEKETKMLTNMKEKESNQSMILAIESKNFICENCVKQFSTLTGLRQHNKSIHEGVRYYCDECGYQATKKYHLKSHINSVHRKLSVTCDKCGKQVRNPNSLRMHKSIVHDGVRYQCEHCEHKASTKQNLRAHQLCQHK